LPIWIFFSIFYWFYYKDDTLPQKPLSLNALGCICFNKLLDEGFFNFILIKAGLELASPKKRPILDATTELGFA